MKTPLITRRALGTAALAVLVFSLVGCGGSSGLPSVAVPELELGAFEYGYDTPAEFPGGITRIKLSNDGDEEHHLQLFRLNEANTFEAFGSTLLQGDPAQAQAQAFAMGTFAGGVNTIPPGGKAEVVQNLQPGDYALICFMTTDGVAHFTKGMLVPLTISIVPAEAQQTMPAPDESVLLTEFSFAGPETLTAGKHVIQVKNKGTQPHEMAVVKLREGATMENLTALLNSGGDPSGNPSYTSSGGMTATAPGGTGLVTLDLDAGAYALICFVPDPAALKSHAALGMVSAIKVE